MKLLIVTTLVILIGNATAASLVGNATAANEPASYCIIPNVEEAYKSATAVFVGEVTNIMSPSTYDKKAPITERLYSIHFKVERSWKGAAFGDVTVLSAQGEGTFAFPPVKKGEKYLVYADPVVNNESVTDNASVMTSCSRTARIPTTSNTKKRSTQFDFDREDGSGDFKLLDAVTLRSSKR